MLLGNILTFDENTVFRNLKKDYLTFTEVYDDIINFIKNDLNSSYRISIGTDSQVASRTAFVTCIHVHRIGKGAIGFLHKDEMARPVKNLREKIYLETCASLQLAYLFDGERTKKIYGILGKKVSFEFHIDIGVKGKTKALINEMTGMVQGLDFIPKIKPDSYCASSFADRYTKAM
jgi:uncharacterized protein